MNEDQYYSPIIQAMIHTATLQKQGAQQEIEKQKNKAEQSAKQEQLKQSQQALQQAQQQIENTHEMQLKQHDIAEQTLGIHRMQADMEAELNRFHALKAAQEVISGAKPGFQLPPGLAKTLQGGPQFQPQQSQPTRQLPIELGGDQQQAAPQVSPAAAPADLTGLFDPEAKGRQEAALVKAKGEAGLPIEKQLIDYKAQVESQLLGKKQEFEKVENALDRKNRLTITGMTNAAHLQSLGMDPNTNQDLVKNAMIGGMTGQYKLNPDNPFDRVVLSHIQNAGARAFDPKEALAARESQNLLPILDRMEKLAQSFPSGTGGAMLQGVKTHGANLLGIPTDLQNKIAIQNADAMVVGKNVEGMTGRPLSTQLKSDLDSLITPGITKDQAIERINHIRENYVNKQNNVVFSGLPDFQRQLIEKTYGIVPIAANSPQGKPDFLKLAPKVNKTGHKLDEEASAKMGQPVYK